MNLPHNSRVLLVEPPFYRFFGYERWHYPLTLTLLATFISELGHSVVVYDADKPDLQCRSMCRTEVTRNFHRYREALETPDHPIWKEVEEHLASFRPEIVGLTSITAKIESANIIARMARRVLGKSVKIILGGPHVQGMETSFPGCKFDPVYDEVVVKIPGLIRCRPNKHLILNWESYQPKNFASILTATGCPNHCTFCCHSFDNDPCFRDFEDLKSELVEIKDVFQVKTPVYIIDDCFFSHTRNFERQTELLGELGLSFIAGSRFMALTKEKISTFINRGGVKINMGVESGSQRILDRVKKHLKIPIVKERSQWLREAHLPWAGFFIVGFPFETLEDIKQTEEFIYTLQPDFVSVNRFTPYPGTEIFNEFFKDSHLKTEDFFQLGDHLTVKMDDEIECYIDGMLNRVDAYNSRKKTA